MHLYKRKDSKFWWYKFVLEGRTYQASTKVRGRREAEGIASKARLDAIEGKYEIRRRKKTPIFKDAMARFLEHTRKQNAANTTKVYTNASKPLNKTFGVKMLGETTPNDIEKCQQARSKAGNYGRPLKPASVNSELGCLRAMFSYFIALEIVSANPVSRVKFLPVDKSNPALTS
jgi:hypothetical protein